MINKGKSGNNNKRMKNQEEKVMGRTKVESTRKASKMSNNKRNNINSVGCNNSGFVNTSRNNNKFGVQ